LFETFQRALVEHDERAWEYIYTTFRPLIIYWALRSGATNQQCAEDFVHAAFLRFIRAISPEKFAGFSTAAALLGYLQRCTSGAVIDEARAMSRNYALDERIVAPELVESADGDDQLLARMSACDAWRYIWKQLRTEEEREVVRCSYVLGMRPAEIYDYRRDLFPSIRRVYEIKRAVLERFRHDRTLRQMVA
jgi:RNA polymerase sigma factor (sigma-70 family)